MRSTLTLLTFLLAAGAAPSRPTSTGPDREPREQVRRTELAFARTMAERDHAAFVEFLSPEAVFIGRDVRRGRAAVAAAWKRFFEEPQAPFAWAPDTVEVLDSGTLALSSGPVHDPAGRRIGTFTSLWRREPDGRWRIVFDKGCPPCESEPAATPRPAAPVVGSPPAR